MERSNQPPKPEGCADEGGENVDLWHFQAERQRRSVPRAKREPQAGPASRLSNSAPKRIEAGGEGFGVPAPNTDATEIGEEAEVLPGPKSVASAEDDARNPGGPDLSRRTNYESQAGRIPQRKEVESDPDQGVGSAHSNPQQSRKTGTEAGEGADARTQSTQATGPVRKTDLDWQTFLWNIAEKASKEKRHRFGGLYSWLNEDILRVCFYRLRKNAASGVDGVTFEDYESNLENNLIDLVGRLKRKSYRARLVRRKNIPKGQGKLRPLGIPALEDKLLQMAVAQILIAIYERDFLANSYGYRPGRGPHDAVRDLTNELFRGDYHFVTEADVKGFFDHIQHDWLLKMLAQRIQDGALLGLIRKWLRAGILEEDGKVIHPETGTPQGGVISPVLANVYLHYVLDLWFERRVKRKNRGRCKLYRFADDFVASFEYRHEAVAFEQALQERLAKFGLELAMDKTKTLRFGRNGGPHNGRFDFLGFEFSWGRSRSGKPIIKRRTARKKLHAGIQRMKEWIKENRHKKLPKLMGKIAVKLQGTWNYYGIIGNGRRMTQFAYETNKALFYWLNRRSQKCSYTWRAFNRLLLRFQVPQPRIREKPGDRMSCQLELSLFDWIAQSVTPRSPQPAHAKAS